MKRRLIFLVGFLFGLVAFQLSAVEQVFEVKGIIRGKLLDGRPVIEHEAIPGYMMAMTMTFNVSDMAEVAALEAGDRVLFQLHVDEVSSYANHFEVIGKEVASSVEKAVASSTARPLTAGDAVPGFKLLDQAGMVVTEEALRERFTVITFMFTRCPIPEFCPLLAKKFSDLQAELLQDATLGLKVRLWSLTLDPEFDTPAVLAGYGKQVGADPDLWSFITGEADALKNLARAFGIVSRSNQGLLDHSLTTALIDPDGKVVKTWTGNRWQADQVLDLIRSSPKTTACCSESICPK